MVAAAQESPRPSTPSSKVRLAVLDESTAVQLRESLHESADLTLAWSGVSLEQLRADRPRVDVLLANINHLGDDPAKAMDELVDLTGAELGIALYAFAKRALLDAIASPRVRTLRSPLNLPILRCQLMGIIARNLLSTANATSTSGVGVTPPRYSRAQLGKLQQVQSAVDCECPNHLSVLLQNLSDFETYSKNCENKNEADAAVHRALYHYTARARALIERAMDEILVHENIQL